MHRRINITLSEETVDLLSRVAKKRDRSGFIDRAIKHYVADAGTNALRKRLAEGYEQRAVRDLAVAEEWFPIDNESWNEPAR
jgi:CopG family transcriptional regulator/antitoxin EndoAI